MGRTIRRNAETVAELRRAQRETREAREARNAKTADAWSMDRRAYEDELNAFVQRTYRH